MKKKSNLDSAPVIPSLKHNPQPSSPPWLLLAQLLALGALSVSFFLLWGSLTGDKLPGCGEQSGCGTVMRSRWAYIFGLPVSLPAIVMYLGTLVALRLQFSSQSSPIRHRARQFLIFAAAAILGAALWFIALQLLVIHAICPFCMVAHSCGGLLGVILLSKVTFSAAPGSVPELKPAWGGLIIAGFAATALLAGGQAIHQPKTYVVDSTSPSGTATNAATTAPGPAASQPPPVQEHRVMRLYGDEFALDLDEVPMMGNTQASRIGVQLFDYSCHYCRQLHGILKAACRQWSNDLAIVSLPMPMDGKCNPHIRRQLPDHTNACEYARIGLAVWRAQRQKLPEYEDWFFAPLRPPAPAEAQAEAMRLVGSNALAKAMADPWVENQLRFNISIYATNRLRYKKTNLPQLVLGTNLVTGVISSNELAFMYTNQFHSAQ